MSSQSSGERRHDDQTSDSTNRPPPSFSIQPPVSTVSLQYQTLTKKLAARTPLQLAGGTGLSVPPAHSTAVTRQTVFPSGLLGPSLDSKAQTQSTPFSAVSHTVSMTTQPSIVQISAPSLSSSQIQYNVGASIRAQSNPPFPTHLPRGASIAAAIAGPKSASTAMPVKSSHTGLTNPIPLGPRGSLINPVIRSTTPPLSSMTRSVSPVVSISATHVSTAEALRSGISIQGSGASSNPSSIQITLQAPRTSSEMPPKPIITHQPPKQIHMTQALGSGFKLGTPPTITPALPPGVAANLPKGKATGTSISNPSFVSTPVPTLPPMSNTISTLATSNANITSIPVAKVPPVRQQQPSTVLPHTVSHTTVPPHPVSNSSMPPVSTQSHDHSRTESSSHHHISSATQSMPHTQGSSSVYVPQAHRATPVTTVMTSSIAISTSLGLTDSRPERTAGLTYPMPYLIPAEYQLQMYQQMAAHMAATMPGGSSLRQGLIPSQTPNLAATLQAASLTGVPNAAAAVRFNPINMLPVDSIRQQQSLSGMHAPFTTLSMSTSADSTGRSTTPSDSIATTTTSLPIPAISAIQISGPLPNTALYAGQGALQSGGILQQQHSTSQSSVTPVSTPNASPRPSILRKRTSEGTPVKKPVCGLNTMNDKQERQDRHSPRPDSRTDSAPQSNTSSPKTPATPAGESQSSTDTALSSEATTPTQNSIGDIKIKQEPPDTLENGFPILNSGSSTLPNSLESSPRKKPRKQLLHANEEIKDHSSTDEDVDEELEKITDIKDELDIKHELRDEYTDDDGIRWTLEKVRPNISLLNFYNISWKPKHNHFLRYTDVKPKEERRPTVNELSNQRGVSQKASGWKLYHMAAQLEDLTDLEKTLFSKVTTIQSSVAPRGAAKHSMMDDSEGILHELTQGNIQRCKLIMDQLEEARTSMLKVLDHKQKIFEIINKHMSKRPIKKKERS